MLDSVFRNIAGDGALHVRSRDEASQERLCSVLRSLDYQHSETDGMTTVTLSSSQLWPFSEDLRKTLDSNEIRTMRAVFIPQGRVLDLRDYFEVEPLERLMERVRASWLIDMLEAGNFTSAFQPIVHALRPKEAFAYEALLRGTDAAAAFSPLELFEIARKVDLVAYLDLVARETAIAEAARHRLSGKLFLNITPSAFLDSSDSLAEMTASFAHYGIERSAVVFELVETEAAGDPDRVADVVKQYRGAGFAVALDDLGSGYASLQMLSVVRPEYVKLDMSLIRNVHLDEYQGLIARKLIETSHELNVLVIAEGVETADEFAWCRTHGADYIQGYFVSHPQLVPRPLIVR